MFSEKPKYTLGENVYKSIDLIINSTNEIMGTSTNLLSHISDLFVPLEDEYASEILKETEKLNDFISSLSTFTKNELQEIKIKAKIAIEKADKRKIKIYKLKEDNNVLKEKIKDDQNEKEKLIRNIDDISKHVNYLEQENSFLRQKSEMEIINKNNEKILKEKYLKQVDSLENDLYILKEKNKTFESNMTKFKRISTVLEEENKKLKNQFGTRTMLYLSQKSEKENQDNLINSLRKKNNDLCNEIKLYKNQVETWQNKCRTLEEKINNSIAKNLFPRFSESIQSKENTHRKSAKKITSFEPEKNEDHSEDDYDSDEMEKMKYKTFSNLNDLLRTVSDKSVFIYNEALEEDKDKELNEKNHSNSFDLELALEKDLNIYDNFFI